MSEALVDSARVTFSGHETFPLRLLWLKKAYDEVALRGATRRTFQEPRAIATFGVGKNMALSMRHWALAAGILEDVDGDFAVSALGRQLIDDRTGLDPYLEHPSSLWLVHLALAGAPEPATSFFYAFNHLNQAVFDRETLAEAVIALALAKGTRTSEDTLRRDIDVFIRSYVSRGSDGGEDASEPLLAELALIRETRLAGQFEFVRGPKPSLADGVFALALWRFWRRWRGAAPTLSAEQAIYAPGSPGRLFKLDEDSVVARLARLGEITNGVLTWTETAGLRQVVLTDAAEKIDEVALVAASYPKRRRP